MLGEFTARLRLWRWKSFSKRPIFEKSTVAFRLHGLNVLLEAVKSDKNTLLYLPTDLMDMMRSADVESTIGVLNPKGRSAPAVPDTEALDPLSGPPRVPGADYLNPKTVFASRLERGLGKLFEARWLY